MEHLLVYYIDGRQIVSVVTSVEHKWLGQTTQ